jgi:hypothetical protein
MSAVHLPLDRLLPRLRSFAVTGYTGLTFRHVPGVPLFVQKNRLPALSTTSSPMFWLRDCGGPVVPWGCR